MNSASLQPTRSSTLLRLLAGAVVLAFTAAALLVAGGEQARAQEGDEEQREGYEDRLAARIARYQSARDAKAEASGRQAADLISGLASTLTVNTSDEFTVSADGLDSDVNFSYTLPLEASGSNGIGFNSSCSAGSTVLSVPFGSQSYSSNVTLYACSAGTYTVTVQLIEHDASELEQYLLDTDIQQVTVIDPVIPNRRPTITGGPTSVPYPEDSTHVVATYTATDPEDDPITWSLEQSDQIHFTIVGRDVDGVNHGSLRFRSPPDYENPRDLGLNNAYSITVVATDRGPDPLAPFRGVTVTVTNKNEQPVVEAPIAGQTLEVGGTSADIDLSDKFSDEDVGDTLRYDATSSQPSVATERVSGSRLIVTPVGVGTSRITVTAYDLGGLSVPQNFTVTVRPRPGSPLPPAPTVLTATATGPNTVELEWVSVSGVTRQRVERRTAGTTIWTTVNDSIPSTINNSYRYIVTGLMPGTLYHFRVSTRGNGTTYDDAWSLPSQTASAETTSDRTGSVTITPPSAPQYASEITASLLDDDDVVRITSWQWQRRLPNTIPWDTISGATSSAYTPVADDIEKQLRATVIYDDRLGPDKTAASAASSPVGVTYPFLGVPAPTNAVEPDKMSIKATYTLPQDPSFEFQLALLFSSNNTFTAVDATFPTTSPHIFNQGIASGSYQVGIRACVDNTARHCGPYLRSSQSIFQLAPPALPTVTPLSLRRALLNWDSVTGATDVEYVVQVREGSTGSWQYPTPRRTCQWHRLASPARNQP